MHSGKSEILGGYKIAISLTSELFSLPIDWDFIHFKRTITEVTLFSIGRQIVSYVGTKSRFHVRFQRVKKCVVQGLSQ